MNSTYSLNSDPLPMMMNTYFDRHEMMTTKTVMLKTKMSAVEDVALNMDHHHTFDSSLNHCRYVVVDNRNVASMMDEYSVLMKVVSKIDHAMLNCYSEALLMDIVDNNFDERFASVEDDLL